MRHRALIFVMILAMPVIASELSTSEQLEANKALVHRFTAETNAANWDAFDALLTEDFSRHSQATAGAQVNSREEFKKLQESFLVSMPDQHITVEMLVAEGDKVAIYATYSGTHTGPMGEIPATGKAVDSKFLAFFRIEERRIAELWVEWDNVAMLSQLGLFPLPAPPND